MMNNVAFLRGIERIAEEKSIDKDYIFEAMELALITAYKKNFDAKENVRVEIDRETGDIKVFSFQNVVKRTTDPDMEITVSKAKKIKPDAEAGDVIEEEVTPSDFGRVAAATAKQVLTQRIREAERDSILEEFAEKEGELVVGTLSREDARNYYVDLGRAHGILPKSETIPGEELVMGNSVKVYITKIDKNAKGLVIILSRTHYNFVKRLFEREIPELSDGTIMLQGVAREPGIRSKVAVFSHVTNIDPIGACIGERGSRISNIIKELGGEKVDLVLYDEDIKKFIANALNPAKDLEVYLPNDDENMALVIANPDNLSLAIGKGGINVKLASRLTKHRLDVKTITKCQEEGIDLSFIGEE